MRVWEQPLQGPVLKIANATVNLQEANVPGHVETRLTNGLGEAFWVDVVPHGQYQITVSSVGYETAFGTVNMQDVDRGIIIMVTKAVAPPQQTCLEYMNGLYGPFEDGTTRICPYDGSTWIWNNVSGWSKYVPPIPPVSPVPAAHLSQTMALAFGLVYTSLLTLTMLMCYPGVVID